MSPTIAVTRKLTPAVEARLSDLFSVRLNANDQPYSKNDLKDAMRTHDALLCTVSDAIDDEIMSVENRRVKMIANFGVGVNNIDLRYAEQARISVSNTPDVLTDATADIALLLILSVTRRAYAAEKMLRTRNWRGFSIAAGLGVGLQGKTLGIIGMGRIGKAVARRAHVGFGMEIIYFNRSRVELSDVPAKTCSDIEEVLANADIVSLHIPGSDKGSPVITSESLSLMKPTAYLINTARGTLIDENALVEALGIGGIAGAGLDVFENEPAVPEMLVGMENVSLLPHIGSATVETRDAMGMMAIDNLTAFFEGRDLPNGVC